MSDRGETEAYLAAELDSLHQAHAAGDQAAVTRRIEHVRAEAGPETAAVLEQMLKEKEPEAPSPPPTQPAFTPSSPPAGVPQLPPRSRKLLIVFLTVVIVMLLLAVTVLVTVIILRPPATTTAPPPPQATGRPAEATTTPPPTSTATSTTNVAPPVAPSEQTWTQAWPQLKQLTMPGGNVTGYTADLDIPQVEQGNAIGPDLAYFDGRLEQDGAALMGTGPATLPTPEDCSYATKSLTANTVTSAEDMVPGKTAWCIVTKKGNLVWLHLLSGGGHSGVYTLRFDLMKWKKSS